MGNILSNNIRVFPTTQRENVDPSAKFTTEYNLTSLLNKLLDRKAFVITPDIDFTCNANIIDCLEFNIMGYFFSIVNLDISGIRKNDTSGYINACIHINRQDYTDSTNFKNWWQIDGKDSTSGYSGITFIDSRDDDNNPKSTFTPMSQYTSNFADLGVSQPFSQLTAETGDKVEYQFTVLEYNSNNVWIPKDSRIKFQTNTDGSQHSLAIDDGELTPAESVPKMYDMRRSAPAVEETFDGLVLNVNSLILFEGELFRLEPEYNQKGDVIFTSTDTNIAIVSSNGLVRGVNKGNCLIIASYNDLNAVCNVTVK